jgi:hypothetical protein
MQRSHCCSHGKRDPLEREDINRRVENERGDAKLCRRGYTDKQTDRQALLHINKKKKNKELPPLEQKYAHSKSHHTRAQP